MSSESEVFYHSPITEIPVSYVASLPRAPPGPRQMRPLKGRLPPLRRPGPHLSPRRGQFLPERDGRAAAELDQSWRLRSHAALSVTRSVWVFLFRSRRCDQSRHSVYECGELTFQVTTLGRSGAGPAGDIDDRNASAAFRRAGRAPCLEAAASMTRLAWLPRPGSPAPAARLGRRPRGTAGIPPTPLPVRDVRRSP